MKTRPSYYKPSARNRRIGRKVLLADRLSHATHGTQSKKAKKPWQVFLRRPRIIALLCFIVIAASAAGAIGTQYYSAKAAIAQKAAAAEKQSKLAKKGLAADACRRQKAAQKADQLGKITYDQLYDYGECDK